MDLPVRKNRSVVMSGTGGYEDKMSTVGGYLLDYRKVLERVRSTHRGRPIDEVRQALREGFDSAALEVWDEVVEDAANLISSGGLIPPPDE